MERFCLEWSSGVIKIIRRVSFWLKHTQMNRVVPKSVLIRNKSNMVNDVEASI